MKSRFRHNLGVVAGVHMVLIAIVAVASAWRGCARKKGEVEIPIDFVVMSSAQAEAAVLEDPVPVIPQERPREPVREKPREKPREKIQKSTERATRSQQTTPRQKTLSAEEIERRLAMGARLGAEDSLVPDEDARCDLIVHRTFYKVWAAPAASEAGDAVAKVSIQLGKDGRVLGRKLVRPSGNAQLDASVMQAAKVVNRISGLTPGYLSRTDHVVIPFRVE